MKIRDRLSLQFTLIFAILLLVVLGSIYLLTERYRENAFYDQVRDRAITTAQIFLAQDNLSKEKFEQVRKKYPLSLPKEVVRIYDDHDNPAFINDSNHVWKNDVIDQIRALENYSFHKGQVQTAGVYYKDNSGNFVVLASAVDTYGNGYMRQLFWVIFTSFFITVFIMYFLGSLFARIALSPITKVINEVRFIRSSSLDKRIQVKESKDEINELSVTFNNLLEHLEQSFNAQKSFVANASHELRTPITSIIGNIEVALSVERERDEYKRVLGDVLGESERLNELINQLFELANANVDVTEFRSIRLDELLWQVKDEWSQLIPGSRIELNYRLPDDPKKFTILGNSHLLFMALGNIVKNAVKFSRLDLVVCGLHVQDGKAIITIIDQGIGIKAEELHNIFQPFFRGSNTRGHDGIGIGLSLSEKIFRLHNASVQVRSELYKGTTFSIIFPI